MARASIDTAHREIHRTFADTILRLLARLSAPHPVRPGLQKHNVKKFPRGTRGVFLLVTRILKPPATGQIKAGATALGRLLVSCLWWLVGEGCPNRKGDQRVISGALRKFNLCAARNKTGMLSLISPIQRAEPFDHPEWVFEPSRTNLTSFGSVRSLFKQVPMSSSADGGIDAWRGSITMGWPRYAQYMKAARGNARRLSTPAATSIFAM